MAYQQKPGDGVLFKNNKKSSDKHPDYTGNLMDSSGKVWSLAAWVKEGNKGKFFSIKMSEPRAKQGTQENFGDLPF